MFIVKATPERIAGIRGRPFCWMKKREIDEKFDEIVDFSGVEKFINTPLKRYSSGMQVRLAFAVAAYLEPEILLVDEVLAVGDRAFTRRCLDRLARMRQRGVTMVLVSHDLGFVATFVRTVICVHRRVDVHPTAELDGRRIGGDPQRLSRHQFSTGVGGDRLSDEHLLPCGFRSRHDLLLEDRGRGLLRRDDLVARVGKCFCPGADEETCVSRAISRRSIA